MTFKDISLKILKANSKRYLSYFLSSSFAIMILFIYSTLLFNQELSEAIEGTTIAPIMIMALILVATFTIFFISYAHTSFIKSRNKEFALFLTLGMTEKDINRMIRTENLIIGTFSLGLGLIAGTIFSRLFFIIVQNVLDLQQIPYSLNYKSYLLTLFSFTLILFIIAFISRRMIKGLQITELLISGRKTEKKHKHSPILGGLGIVLLIISFLLFFLHLDGIIFPDKNNWMIAFLILALIGLYFSISQFTGILLAVVKRNKLAYYRNLINISETNHKYRSNVKILYIITILTAVVIFFMGISYSFYSETLKVAAEEQPYHLAYILDKDENQEVKEKINQQIQQVDSNVIEKKTIEYISGAVSRKYNSRDIWVVVPSISEETYHSLTGERLNLKKGEVNTILLTAKPERHPWYAKATLTYQVADNIYDFRFNEEISGIPFNIFDQLSRMMVILNTDDYLAMKNKTEDQLVKEVHLVNYDDWRKIEGLDNKIKEIQIPNINQEAQSFINVKPKPTSRIGFYQEIQQQYGFLLFILGFIGILFFIASGNVLYFKLKNDLEASKEKFNILKKLGIGDNEMKRMISRELKIIFFIPSIIGIIIGFTFIGILTVNLSIRADILFDTILIAIIYLFLQWIYYAVSKKIHYQALI